VYLSNFNRTETYWASMTCCFHDRSCGNWVETRFVSCMWSYIRAWASPHTWANNTTSRCQLLIVPTRRDRPWSLRSSAPNTPRQFLSCDLQKLLYTWQDEVFSYGLCNYLASVFSHYYCHVCMYVLWRISLFIVGFSQQDLFTLQCYNYFQLVGMDPPFTAAAVPTIVNF
jgi:hypothetical protein